MRETDIIKIIDEMLKTKFHNLSYRDYYGLNEKYLISVHPYAIHIYKIIKPINNWINILNDINFGTGNYIKLIIDYHKSDYINDICLYNPCEIYEKVSGYNSLMENDNIGETSDYWDNKKDIFNKYLITHKRKEKLININKSI